MKFFGEEGMVIGSNDDSFWWCFVCFFWFDEEWDSYVIGVFVDVF